MVMSMTGFGRSEITVKCKDIIIEIRSVNHRYLEISTRISRGYNFLEDKIKKHLSEKISRGKVDVFISIIDNDDSSVEVELNKPLVLGYINAMKVMSEECGVKNDVNASHLSRFPDVFQIKRAKIDEEEAFENIKPVLDLALDQFLSMRKAEGEKLKNDVLSRADYILNIVSEIEEYSPQTVAQYKERLTAKINEVLSGADIDEQRILTEVAIFADKVAVDEETVRLRSHIDQMITFFESDQPIGRKLDFIIQEMNREANTIGSKVSDSLLAHKVVDIKSEIEKIREQVQNIE